MRLVTNEAWKNEKWYAKQFESGKYLADTIHKYHSYFSKQDKKYRRIVRILRITVLVVALINTVLLGIRSINADAQVTIGIISSAVITLVTAISSYFNFEEYWMRNINIHIQLNLMRDNFILDAEIGPLGEDRINCYMEKLNKIQEGNIKYWEKAIKKV